MLRRLLTTSARQARLVGGSARAPSRGLRISAARLSTAATAPAPPAATAPPAAASDPFDEHESLWAELERLRALPWYKSGFLALAGTFSKSQWQAAAGTDMFVSCMNQAAHSALFDADRGAVDTRLYTRFQLQALHAWITHVRLRSEPPDEYGRPFKEMMEKLWETTTKDMGKKAELGMIQILKNLKEMQLGWHGLCHNLDAAIAGEDADARDRIAQLLLLNIYVDADGARVEGAEASALWLADYVITQINHHQNLPSEQVLRGAFTWAPPPPAT